MSDPSTKHVLSLIDAAGYSASVATGDGTATALARKDVDGVELGWFARASGADSEYQSACRLADMLKIDLE